ncbi:MAG: DUF2914 domain-containing protein [Candidatus Margulisiibacteriota bacterium]|nr:DUF2914 domain-containing protein [Candidatus Margulisiibacteriota bacterium]
MKKIVWIVLIIVLIFLGGYIFLNRGTKSDITDELFKIAETDTTGVTTEDTVPANTVTTSIVATTTIPIVKEKKTIVAPVGQGLSITGALGTGVEGRVLVGEASEFGKDVGRVYCVITVTGANGPTEVAHVWYFNDQEKANTTLPIKYKKHRTWSYKTIHPQHVGNWRVDVINRSGKVLKSFSFVIGE